VPLLTNKDVSLLTRGKLISRVSIAIGQDNTWTGDTIMKRSIFQLILAIDFMAFYFTKTYILFIVDKDFLGPQALPLDPVGGLPQQGRSEGGYIGIYTLPKSVPENYSVH